MPRIPASMAAFREMLGNSLEEPRRKEAGNLMREALNRSMGKGKTVDIRTGLPQFPSRTIFDYSDFGADPRAYLERKDIALPKTERGFESPLHAFRSPNTVKALIDAAQTGAGEGGHLWYNTAPIHDFAHRYAPEADVSEFLRIGAPFSAQTEVGKELKQTAFVNYFLKKHGRLPGPEEMMGLEKSILGGGGSMVDKLQWAQEGLDQGHLQAPRTMQGSIAGKGKLIPYEDAREGNTWNAVMDSWMLGGLGMSPGANVRKKGAAELGMKMLAERSGMLPRNFQSSAWTEMQGDKRPLALILDNLVDKSAEAVGKNPTEHMADVLSGKDYIRNEPQQFAGGGLAQYIRHRLMQEAKNAQYGGMRQKLQGWAQEEISDPFDVRASGRKALALGPDKVVKLVGRYPRGIAEQGWEGEGDLQYAGVIPQLHYRSPENELAVVERIPHTEESAQGRYMGPLERMFEDAHMDLRREHGANWYRYGHQVPEIAQAMRERGLGAFLNYPEMASGDFFAPSHWGFRQPYKGPATSRGVLLDPGAMEANLVEKSLENEYSPQMRSIATARAKWLMQHGKLSADEVERKITTDPGSLIDDFSDDLPALERHTRVPLTGEEQRSLPLRTPDPEQLDMPFAQGGPVSLKLAQALMMLRSRSGVKDAVDSEQGAGIPDQEQGGLNPEELSDWQGYAPGGVVRNWLRGVPGSGIDKALGDLRAGYPHDVQLAERMRGQPNADRILARNKAMSEWIDRNLGNYIVRQMGTADDPLAGELHHLAGPHGDVQNSLVRRIPAAQVPERLRLGRDESEGLMERVGRAAQEADESWRGKAPSWLQKLIDEDTPRNQKAAQLLKERAQALEKIPRGRQEASQAGNDYVNAVYAMSGKYLHEGLPDPIMLHDLDPAAWRQHMAGPMQGVMDYLSQNYTPEQLEKISVPDAWRGSATWHEALAKKKAEALKDPFAGTLPHKEYPSGFKWVKFDHESPVLKEALEGEGNVMGHCVGGYCDDVQNQSSHIYSLRDPQGKAHVTVEVNPGEKERQHGQVSWGESDESLPQNISQIKGKGNKKPAAQYLPYVQDFVRSGKWGGVGDLHNTGLEEIMSSTGKTRYMTPEESAPFASQRPHTPRDQSGAPLPDVKKGRYVKGDNYVDYEIPEDWQPGPIPGMAEGGLVPATEEIIIDGNKSKKENIERNKPKTTAPVPPIERTAPNSTLDQMPNSKDVVKPKAIWLAEGGQVELEQADHEDALAYLQELLGDHAQA